jgi:hypothetical protein
MPGIKTLLENRLGTATKSEFDRGRSRDRSCLAEIHPSRFWLLSILRVRRRQIATMRMPPNTNERSPTLNSPSRAWSARNGSRVFCVAARHIGLAGCSVDGIPTTGIVPALASVTRASSISPHSISRTPARTQGDRTARTTSHRIAQDSHSQIVGCCVHAK